MNTPGDLTKKLFPYTPIEIVFELGKWAVYVEGDWYANSNTKPTAHLIDYIIKRHSDDWIYPSTRINPNWTGWSQITEYALVTANRQAETGNDGVPRNHDKCLED